MITTWISSVCQSAPDQSTRDGGEWLGPDGPRWGSVCRTGNGNSFLWVEAQPFCEGARIFALA
ncbi:MAG: hypothetical protein CMA80_00140 [Euryarchaeota archaeon]|nr:hypothetical protein [Euryarchaeota archaeon]